MASKAGVTILWLTGARRLRLKPMTPYSARLARSAIASFWTAEPAAWPAPAMTLAEVFALGHSTPELHITYLYHN